MLDEFCRMKWWQKLGIVATVVVMITGLAMLDGKMYVAGMLVGLSTAVATRVLSDTE